MSEMKWSLSFWIRSTLKDVSTSFIMDVRELDDMIPPPLALSDMNDCTIVRRNRSLLCSKLKKITLRRNKTLSEACKEQGMSTKTYYKYVRNPEICLEMVDNAVGSSLLTEEEEKLIISQIEKHHLSSSCIDGKAVREIAFEIYRSRSMQTKEFSRQWWHRFLNRHKDQIGVRYVQCVDDERLSFTVEDIDTYQREVENVLPLLEDYRLFLNIDETGFGNRMNYKKSKKIVFSKNVPCEPIWHAPTEQHHVSWISAITASGELLKPHLISTRKKFDDDFYSTPLPGRFHYSCSSKGYLTNAVMVEWIREILAHHVNKVRTEINRPDALVIVLLDGLSSHKSDCSQIEFQKLAPIKIITLPRHSSHVTQPTDLVLFSATKNKYKTIKISGNLSPFTTKLLKVYRAIVSSSDCFNIMSCFKRAGFDHIYRSGKLVRIELNKIKFQEFRERARNQNMK